MHVIDINFYKLKYKNNIFSFIICIESHNYHEFFVLFLLATQLSNVVAACTNAIRACAVRLATCNIQSGLPAGSLVSRSNFSRVRCGPAKEMVWTLSLRNWGKFIYAVSKLGTKAILHVHCWLVLLCQFFSSCHAWIHHSMNYNTSILKLYTKRNCTYIKRNVIILAVVHSINSKEGYLLYRHDMLI